MLEHLGMDLGAEKSLTTMLSNNAKLLEGMGENEINTFIRLIKSSGLQAKYLDFLTALCSCLDTAIMSNQQMICKKVLRDNSALLIKTTLDTSVGEDNTVKFNSLSGDEMILKGSTDAVWGYDVRKRGMYPIVLTWTPPKGQEHYSPLALFGKEKVPLADE